MVAQDVVGQRPLSPPPSLGTRGPSAGNTFSRSLAKSWPSFSWSKLAMNCWQDIFLPMFCSGETVLPESRDGGWCGPHSLPHPARSDEAASRAVMKEKIAWIALCLQEFAKLSFTFKILFDLQAPWEVGALFKPRGRNQVGWSIVTADIVRCLTCSRYYTWHALSYFLLITRRSLKWVLFLPPFGREGNLRCGKVKWRAHDHTARKWKGWVLLTPQPVLSPAPPRLSLPQSHSTRTWTQASWLLSRSPVYPITTVSPSHLYRGAANLQEVGAVREGLVLRESKFSFHQHTWVPHAELGWDQGNPSKWFHSRRHKQTNS